MRLTLRTILAYLDDVLEPAQARVMGERIADGKEASALISRIRDVLRRRRIGAPELSGPGSGPDPNVVSDYLENLLPPDQVVELERLCQASDVHLAEVAGCHKILTMVLGQPIDVSDDIRERIYALGSAKSAAQHAESSATPMAEGIGSTENSPYTSGLPDYLRQRSLSQRYGTALAILLVAGGWMALVVTDRTLWTRPEMPSPETIAQVEDPAPANSVPAPGVKNGQGAPAQPVAVTPGNVPAVPMNTGSLPSETPMPMPPDLASHLPSGDMPKPDPEVMVPEIVPETVIVPVSPVLPEQFPELRMTYLSGDDVVLQPHAVDPGWFVSGRDLPIELGETLVSPNPFRSSFRIGEDLTLGMQPGTRIQRLMSPAQGDFAFALNQGQVTLVRSSTSQKPLTVRVRVLGQDYTIKLLEPGTRIGLELAPVVPNGPNHGQAEVVMQGGLVVLEGKVSAADPLIELGPQSGYAHWPASAGGTWSPTDDGLPAWATVDGAFVSPATRQFGKLFAKELSPMIPVEESLVTLSKDRRAGISELAVRTLGIIGYWNDLVPALKSDHQESRLAAISGLRHLLAMNPGLEPQIREELTANFPTDKVDPLMRLLWGFRPEDARSPEESAKLIGWMKDDEIAIRELAFLYVSKLTARTHDYLPMAPAAERRAALGRWEDFVKRNNGALVTD